MVPSCTIEVEENALTSGLLWINDNQHAAAINCWLVGRVVLAMVFLWKGISSDDNDNDSGQRTAGLMFDVGWVCVSEVPCDSPLLFGVRR